MRITFVVTALTLCATAFAQLSGTKTPTPLDYDHAFLMLMRDLPEEDSLQKLAGAGVAEVAARKLLAYLEEHMDDFSHASHEYVDALCKNVDNRFATSAAIAGAIQRWDEDERMFKAGLVRESERILGVASMSTVREASSLRIGLSDSGVMDEVLSGRLTPEMIIERSCELAKQYPAPTLLETAKP